MGKKYIFAIDETGSFLVRTDKRSFVCGVQIAGNELDLKKGYQKTYIDFHFPAPVPTRTDELLTNQDAIEDNARFHFNSLSDEQIDICKTNLLPFVERVFVSSGSPSLYANNQNWWLIAIVVVIRKFLTKTTFEADAEIEIWIDNRNDKVWGVLDENKPGFKEYHDILISQIKNSINKYVPKNVKCTPIFKSDTSSFFINLADITCGFVRKQRHLLADKITDCPCQAYTENIDPVAFISKKPMMAYTIVLQELTNGIMDNVQHIKDIIAKLRKEKENYTLVWDMFYDLLKFKIEERKHQSHLVQLKQVVDFFLDEFAKSDGLLNTNKRLEMMVLLTEYYSHIGDINHPFSKQQFLDLLKDTSVDSETRLLRKWEKLVSYSLRDAQLLFNNFQFDEVEESFMKLWDGQEKIINALTTESFISESRKDEPTTAILGTLAQAYAYNDDLDNAIEYFSLSKEYAIRTTTRTDSYLFNIYHRRGEVENCRLAFLNQTGMTPEEYGKKQDYSNLWNLLSYCKLCALELQVKKETQLTIPYSYVQENQLGEYPYPLILKWVAIALYLQQDKEKQVIVEKLFSDAISQLLNDNNGFTIKLLALPIIQCYATVNNQNPYHSLYDRYLRELKSQSSYFAAYIDKKTSILNSIKSNADMWQRAMCLPFIYS